MKLIDSLSELYWSLGEYSIEDKRRMKAVIHELSQTIRRALSSAMSGFYNVNPRHRIAAAALEAAADQVGEWDSAEELRAIAAELRAQ